MIRFCKPISRILKAIVGQWMWYEKRENHYDSATCNVCNNNGHQIVQCGFLDLSMQLCFKNDGFHNVVLKDEKRGNIQYLHVLWCVVFIYLFPLFYMVYKVI